MAGWMSASLRSTRAVCSGELSLPSSMSVGGGGCGCKEVSADRVQADEGVGKVDKSILTSLSKDQSVVSLSSKVQPPSIKNSATCTVSTSSLTMEGEAVTQEWKDEAVDDFP